MALERAKCVPTPLQSCSKTRGLPGLPPLPQAVKEPSDLYKIVLRNSEHPPIMKGTSWTLAAPFKEQKYHRTPSESIANNYTPSASDLKMKDLPKLQKLKTRASINGPLVQSPRKLTRSKTILDKIPNGKPTNGHAQNGHDLNISPEVAEVEEMPPSRPLTPHEQIDIMMAIEYEDDIQTGLPTDRDLERYYYYVEKGINKSMIAQPNPSIMKNVCSMVPSGLLTNHDLDPMIQDLSEEINHDYEYSIRKSIVDYILKDSEEKARLHISTVPKSFPQRIIRAPVPWHETFLAMKEYNKTHLFITNPIMQKIQDIWFDEFNSLRFINLKELERADLPLLPSEFESLIRKQCWEAHEVLRKSWIPTCAKVFVDNADNWQYLVGPNDSDSTELVQEFFSAVAAVMSGQLRGMVINSLHDFLHFFQTHKEGNDYGEDFNDLRYVMAQVMIIKLRVEEPKIVFDPPFREIRDIILRCFSEIIASGEGLMRVECQLFPDMRGQKLLLRSVKIDESLVTDYVDKSMEIFKLNTVGPQKYLTTYKKYLELLNNKAEQDVSSFLRESHSIAAFKSDPEEDASSGFGDGSSLNTSHDEIENLTGKQIHLKIDSVDSANDEIIFNVPTYIASGDISRDSMTELNKMKKPIGIEYFKRIKSLDIENETLEDIENETLDEKNVDQKANIMRNKASKRKETRRSLVNGMTVALKRCLPVNKTHYKRVDGIRTSNNSPIKHFESFDHKLGYKIESFSVYKKLGKIEPRSKSCAKSLQDRGSKPTGIENIVKCSNVESDKPDKDTDFTIDQHVEINKPVHQNIQIDEAFDNPFDSRGLGCEIEPQVQEKCMESDETLDFGINELDKILKDENLKKLTEINTCQKVDEKGSKFSEDFHCTYKELDGAKENEDEITDDESDIDEDDYVYFLRCQEVITLCCRKMYRQTSFVVQSYKIWFPRLELSYLFLIGISFQNLYNKKVC